MAKRPLPSPEVIRQLLSYDPETGKLFWKRRDRALFPTDMAHRMWNGRYAGKEAATSKMNTGYYQTSVFDNHVLAHRAIWAIVYGAWPEQHIDHANGDRADNRLSNLRLATVTENLRNTATRKDNRSGFKGVSWHKSHQLWRAVIAVNGKQKYLGRYKTREEAAAAYDMAARQHYGEFARTNGIAVQ